MGPPLNPWHPKNPHRIDKYNAKTVGELFEARQKQSLLEAEHQELRLQRIRLERRTSSRQLGGGKSGGSSASISRTNSDVNLPRTGSSKSFTKEFASFERLGPLGRTSTGDSTTSSRSEHSTRSRRSTLSRVFTAERNDRNAKGYETRQEQQLRESGTGTDSEPDSASYGGQGFGGLSGKHAEKSTRCVYSHFVCNHVNWAG